MLDYERGAALLTNTLGIVGPRVSLVANVTVHQLPDLRKEEPVSGQFQETLIINASPVLFSLTEMHAEIGRFQVQGFVIQMFRDTKGRPLFHLRTFDSPRTLYATDIANEAYWKNRALVCSRPYLNQTLTLNLTLDFQAGNLTLDVNGDHCLHHRIDPNVFHEERVFFSLMASATLSSPTAIYLDEVSVYKRLTSQPPIHEHFAYSMHRLSRAQHTNDPHYLKNVSLANTFVNGVG